MLVKLARYRSIASAVVFLVWAVAFVLAIYRPDHDRLIFGMLGGVALTFFYLHPAPKERAVLIDVVIAFALFSLVLQGLRPTELAWINASPVWVRFPVGVGTVALLYGLWQQAKKVLVAAATPQNNLQVIALVVKNEAAGTARVTIESSKRVPFRFTVPLQAINVAFGGEDKPSPGMNTVVEITGRALIVVSREQPSTEVHP